MIVVVADTRTGALASVAQGIKAESPSEISTVFSSDFPFLSGLAEQLIDMKAAHVHFLWRGEALRLMQSAPTSWNRLRAATCLSFSIPDHVHLDGLGLETYWPLFQQIHGYSVSNTALMATYSSLDGFPSPLAVVVDPVDVPEIRKHVQPVSPGKVTWVGNSRWGTWIPSFDYKGLETIARPAIKLIQDQGVDAQLHVIDSARGHTPHGRTLDAIATSSVLLSTSMNEGTGLPALEAMALGVPVVSTRVGLIDEIAGPEQMQFLAPRRVGAIAERLEHLLTDEDAWVRVAEENATVMNHYPECAPGVRWLTFFQMCQDARSRLGASSLPRTAASNRRRRSIPERLMEHSIDRARRNSRLASVAKDAAFRWPAANRMISAAVSRSSRSVDSYVTSTWLERHPMGSVSPVVALYNPNFLGVSRSTRTIFRSSIPLPTSSVSQPSKVLREWADQLKSSGVSVAVLSGTDSSQLKFATYLRDSGIECWSLWHGSPAQFYDIAHRHHWREIVQAVHGGTVSRVLVLSEELGAYCDWLGISNGRLMNSIPHAFRRMSPEVHPDGRLLSAALWTSGQAPGKNFMTQALAVLQCDLHLNVSQHEDLDWAVVPAGHLGKISLWPKVTDETIFARMLGSVDLVMAVTHHEASATTPLEALGVGTPFLTGPSSLRHSLWGGLRDLVVVDEPDSLFGLKSAIQRMTENSGTFGSLRIEVAKEVIAEASRINSITVGSDSVAE